MNYRYHCILSTSKDFKDNDIPQHLSEDEYIEILQKIGFTGYRFETIARKAYRIWKDSFNLAKVNIPFRFPSNIFKNTTTTKYIKLARCYKGLGVLTNDKGREQAALMCSDENGHTIEIQLGNGLGRGQAGYKFEDEILSALCTYMVNGCSLESLDYNSDITRVLTNIHESELNEILLAAYQEFIKSSTVDVTNIVGDELVKLMSAFIYKTGESNNRRNIDNIIPVDNTSNISFDTLRHDSGKIISDITLKLGPIKSKFGIEEDDVYLSLKKSKAQLSGVIVSPSRRGIYEKDSKWMDKILSDQNKNPKTGEVIPLHELDKNAVKAFTEFWRKFHVDPDSVYNAFMNDVNEEQSISLTKDMSKSSEIGQIIQNLIGGNYWYISPDHCLYIPYKDKKWTFSVKSCTITASKRTINIFGKLNGQVDMKLCVRDSSGGNYAPNRLFPVVNDISELYNNIGEDI